MDFLLMAVTNEENSHGFENGALRVSNSFWRNLGMVAGCKKSHPCALEGYKLFYDFFFVSGTPRG